MERVGIRRAIVALFACVAAMAVAMPGTAKANDPALVGQWSAPLQLGMPAIHAAMLDTGKVLIWSPLEPGSNVGSRAAVWDPSTGTVTPAPIPFRADTF